MSSEASEPTIRDYINARKEGLHILYSFEGDAITDSELLSEKVSQQSIEDFALRYRNVTDRLIPSSEQPEQVPERAHLDSEPLTVGIDQPLCGSYNAVYCLKYSDDVRYALRLPRSGYEGRWNSEEADEFTRQVHLLQFLRCKTSIPVPTVIDYSASFKNPLGYPFVLLEWIRGLSARQMWHDVSCPEHQLRARRVRLICDLTTALDQLDKFSFNGIGAPDMSVSDGIYVARPFNIEAYAFPRSKTVTVGPFYDETSFFEAVFQRQTKSLDSFDQWLSLFVRWAVEQSHEGKFTLAHRDLHLDNLVVDEDGHLIGVLDWDLALAAPRCVGNANYPPWLDHDLVSSISNDDECRGGYTSRTKPDYLQDISHKHSHLHHEFDYYRAVWRHCIHHHYRNGSQRLGGFELRYTELSVDIILATIPRSYQDGLREGNSLGMSTILCIANNELDSEKLVFHLLSKICMLERKRPKLLKREKNAGDWHGELSNSESESIGELSPTSSSVRDDSSDEGYSILTSSWPETFIEDGDQSQDHLPSGLTLVCDLEEQKLKDAYLANVRDWFLYLLYSP